MKRSLGHKRHLGEIRNLLIGSALILAMVDTAFGEALSATSQDLAECAKIEDHGERLKCYNKATGRQSGNMAIVKEPVEKSSYFSRLWELDPEFRTGKYPFSLIAPITFFLSLTMIRPIPLPCRSRSQQGPEKCGGDFSAKFKSQTLAGYFRQGN